MAMHKVLVTGDFWHTDFQKIVSKFDVPVTLVPFDKVDTVLGQNYDLVVLAQSRRDQFLEADVERLLTNFPSVPIVGLLGSWCEGESRSGRPFPRNYSDLLASVGGEVLPVCRTVGKIRNYELACSADNNRFRSRCRTNDTQRPFPWFWNHWSQCVDTVGIRYVG